MVTNAEMELKRQLPTYFRPILEFGEIMKAHGYALDQLEEKIFQTAANHYIPTCDEQTIAYYEQLLGIVYHFGDTLEYRRMRVLQKFNTIVPFTIGFLREKLTELYGADGYELSVSSADCTIAIKITSGRYGAVDLLYALLWDVLPAHLAVTANQETTNNVGGKRLYAAGFAANTLIQTIGGNE